MNRVLNPIMHGTFMKRAIELAIENVARGGGPFGAVIVQEGAILSQAANQVTTLNDPTAHAEMLAIRLACQQLEVFDLQGCQIYTSCEPCPMCLGAIYWARISRIYFGSSAAEAAAAGFDDALIYRELAQPRALRRIPIMQMMEPEAQAPFQAWQKKSDKIEY